MKAFGYDFNVGGGVVFDKTIEEAINQIKQDIQNEYKNKDVERALNSLQVYDLELAI